jgi:polyisoprenyl-teichoic acid--peptidoglycan teichoic acid transferase
VTSPDLEATQRIPVLRDHQPMPEAEAGHTPRRRGPRLAWLGRLLLLLMLVVVGIVAAALLVTPARESVLILGSDARPDELRRGEVGRTDTLMLLVADRATPRLATVSVPRDLWVAIPGNGEERINAAYELGGSQTAKQTVSNILGQRVDRYALIGLQGVRDVVDAVGGVDITVEQAIHDDAYPTDDYGYMTVDIPAGPQHMDGETALEYARTRHQDSDFGRQMRQQRVLSAVRQALLRPINWWRAPAVFLAVQKAIKTDVTPLDAIAVGAAVLRNGGDPDRLVIDTTLTTPVTGEGGAFLLEAKPDLKPAVARFLGGGSPASARLEVQNGTGVAGLARTTADRLTQSGYQVVSVGDADRTQVQTTIQTRPETHGLAADLASSLRLPATRVTDTASLPPGVDIRLILGPDAR